MGLECPPHETSILDGNRCLELSPQLGERSLSLQEGLPLLQSSDILQTGANYSFDLATQDLEVLGRYLEIHLLPLSEFCEGEEVIFLCLCPEGTIGGK